MKMPIADDPLWAPPGVCRAIPQLYWGSLSRRRTKPGTIDLADAMNVIVAARQETNIIIAADLDYRFIAPLSGHAAFRLLPADN
ncbi:MAG: hypothetical protein LBE08_05105 [Bifidobacteriaceae bacterium]|jgi:hypothetical protein|nr:hypothetical protein [Bifidobacteriaceae bacterium]